MIFPAETIYCTQCLSFSTRFQIDLGYHIPKKYSASQPKLTHGFQQCGENFPSFYSPRQNKIQHNDLRRMVEHELTHQILRTDDLKNKILQDDLQPCKHFLLDGELKR